MGTLPARGERRLGAEQRPRQRRTSIGPKPKLRTKPSLPRTPQPEKRVWWMKQPWTVVLFEAGWVGLMVGVGAFCIFVWPLETNGDVDSPAGRTALEALAIGAAVFGAIAAGRSARNRTPRA